MRPWVREHMAHRSLPLREVEPREPQWAQGHVASREDATRGGKATMHVRRTTWQHGSPPLTEAEPREL
jgi:hypothetical protein